MPTAAVVPRSFLTVEALLGGQGVLQAKPHSSMDWVAVIRRGIPAAAVESLTKSIRMTQAELATALGISDRSLARRKREVTFNS